MDAFAKTGNPNYNENINWPQSDTEERAILFFDNDIEVVEVPLDKERQMWYGMNIWAQF